MILEGSTVACGDGLSFLSVIGLLAEQRHSYLLRGRGCSAPRPLPPVAGWGSCWLGGRVLFVPFSVLFPPKRDRARFGWNRLGLWVTIGSSWFSFVFGRKFESDRPCYTH